MSLTVNLTVKNFKLPQNPALVVVSDVHIKTEDDERYLQLCQLVDEASRVSAGSLVLNGDIFDFFFGWGGYFRGKYGRLLRGLDKLVDSGAVVWFVSGNHEFGLEALSRHHKFEVVPSEGKVWNGRNGEKILISHGDLLRFDPWYDLYRRFIRSHFVSVLAVIFPQKLLDLLTLWFARTSRKKDRYRTLNHGKIIESASNKLNESLASTIIIGHFNHPNDEQLGNGKRLLSVNSWDQPSCLAVSDNGRIERIFPDDNLS